ncbi:hypothetical protein HNY73_012623 [Argiope bruennichi]|uniref:Uncharacterized protein n=1 Tax=Argiope bruennichi TaxID=94029 RepID=A0A8T0EXA9_ARGBR|nr:hypothetical protein HNY73_012623 [Argiope bruennichi]
MASLEESLIASAIEAMNIEDYWPTFDSTEDLDDDDDSEYSIILYFYEELLSHLIQRHKVQDGDLQQAIKHLVYNYGHVANGKTPMELDYNYLSNCLGYLHRYAACHTALVLSIMIRIFHKCPPPAVRRILALKNQLNVVCIGGGPSNDLVGFLSAIYGKHFGLLDLDITVVDKMSGWELIFQETIRRLRLGECGNVSKIFKDINVKTSFLQGDFKFPSTWNNELKVKLANADIMLLTKVLSVVPDADKLVILKNIVLSMKPGALLIFIDCPYPSAQFQALQKYLDIIYEASKEKFQFDFEVQRFGFPNITSSRAVVRAMEYSSGQSGP